jgi:aldehyde dehydrogenase (NAD+)
VTVRVPDTAVTTYVDGRWEPGKGEPFTTVNPGTGAELATWTGSSTDQATAAVAAARRTFDDDDGGWRRRPPAERADVLRRLADLLEEHHEELAQLVTAEVGSPISLARTLQTATPVVNFRWAADRAVAGPRGGYREELPPLGGPVPAHSVLLREPVGVVTAITP